MRPGVGGRDGNGEVIPDRGNGTCKGLEEERCLKTVRSGKDLYEIDNRKAFWEQVTDSIESKLKSPGFILRALGNQVRLG